MAYARHTWDCGEVVTNEKLNNIEDGIEEALGCCGQGNESFVLYLGDEYTCGNKSGYETSASYNDIMDAVSNYRPMFFQIVTGLDGETVLQPVLFTSLGQTEYVYYVTMAYYDYANERIATETFTQSTATDPMVTVDCWTPQ